MIDSLILLETLLVNLIQSIFFAPYHCPLIVRYLLIISELKGLIDAIREIRAILDLGTKVIWQNVHFLLVLGLNILFENF
jgi:hypothetical protein